MNLYPDTLTSECKRIRDAALVAAHLADKVDEIRHMMPLGYATERAHDGISRPTEALATALEDRGVTALVMNARRDLAQAASLLERAVKGMDKSLDKWEGASK